MTEVRLHAVHGLSGKHVRASCLRFCWASTHEKWKAARTLLEKKSVCSAVRKVPTVASGTRATAQPPQPAPVRLANTST